MTAPTAVSPASRAPALVQGLLDDAAIFPPGNVPVPEAWARHAQHVRVAHTPLVGPFLCSEVRWPELTTVVEQDVEPVAVGLVVTGGAPAVASAVRAERLAACLVRDLPLKLTAGLHKAVRHRDPVTGFEHHGFLNVVLAVAAGREGGSVDHLTGLLAERDPEAVRSAVARLTRSRCPQSAGRSYRSAPAASTSPWPT